MTDPVADAERPRRPRRPDAPQTAVGRPGQQALVRIHDPLRAELDRVVRAVPAAAPGARRAADARALVRELTMGVDDQALVVLDRALVGMLTEQASALPQVPAALEDLWAGLLSHLAYEEDELLPALGRLEVHV